MEPRRHGATTVALKKACSSPASASPSLTRRRVIRRASDRAEHLGQRLRHSRSRVYALAIASRRRARRQRSVSAVKEFHRQRLRARFERFPQIVERQATAASSPARRARRRAPTSILRAGPSGADLRARPHTFDELEQLASGALDCGSRRAVAASCGIARQPSVRRLIEIGDRVVGHRSLANERRAHGWRGVVFEPIQDRPHSARRQRRQRLDRQRAKVARLRPIDRQRRQSIEDRGALSER